MERRHYAAMAITASVNTTRARARGMVAWFGGFVSSAAITNQPFCGRVIYGSSR